MLLDLSNSFDVNKATVYFEKLKKDGAKIELRKILPARSTDANSYLHVCIAMFSGATGYTREEILDLMSYQIPEIMRYDKGGHNFRRSTTTLDSKEMSVLIDLIRRIAREELGAYIPDSQEYLISKFQIDRDVQNAKI